MSPSTRAQANLRTPTSPIKGRGMPRSVRWRRAIESRRVLSASWRNRIRKTKLKTSKKTTKSSRSKELSRFIVSLPKSEKRMRRPTKSKTNFPSQPSTKMNPASFKDLVLDSKTYLSKAIKTLTWMNSSHSQTWTTPPPITWSGEIAATGESCNSTSTKTL